MFAKLVATAILISSVILFFLVWYWVFHPMHTYLNANPRSSQLRAQRQLHKHLGMRFKL